MSFRETYAALAKNAARLSGRPATFTIALTVVVIWAVSGPFFGFSETWQLVINTATTIVTFLMVFLIQNSQNRDTEAMQIKLDELIRAHHGAQNALLDLEELNEETLDEFKQKYQAIALKARETLPTEEEGKRARARRPSGNRRRAGPGLHPKAAARSPGR
jgi:low affinity Fe/Cu permease